MSDDAPPSLRTTLIFSAVIVAIGMVCVSFAFYLRWVDTGELKHPFPILLFFGVPLIFFGTRSLVREIVAYVRAKRR